MRIMNIHLALPSSTPIRVCLLLLFAQALAYSAEPPVISFSTEGTQKDETVLLCGDGFDQEGLEVKCWMPAQPVADEWKKETVQRSSLERVLAGKAPLPQKPDGKLVSLRDISVDSRYTCSGKLPALKGPNSSVHVLYLKTKHGSAAPWLLNRPKLWWSAANTSAPRTQRRLFGRNLASRFGSGPAAWLRNARGELTQLHVGAPRGTTGHYDMALSPPYELGIKLPENLSPGNYEVFVHNGSGGDFGWSAPLKIAVKAPRAVPRKIVKASSHGAIVNDNICDSKALEDALAAAAALPGGGIVQLEPGFYHISRTLKLPAHSVLRGAGRTNTILTTVDEAALSIPPKQKDEPRPRMACMIWLQDECALEHLSVRGVPETLCALIGPAPVEDTGKRIAVRDCMIVNRNPRWKDAVKYSFAGNSMLISGATEDLKILNCFVEGASPIASGRREMKNAVISGNRLTSFPPGRTDCALFRKPHECIFEDNYFLNCKRGLVIQPSGMAVHNLVANNRIEHTERGNVAGEVELWEGGTVQISGTVASAEGLVLTSNDLDWERVHTMRNDRRKKGRKKEKLEKRRAASTGQKLREKAVGCVCLITRGRGLGQYRLILSLTENTLKLDRPWDVAPGPGAEFVITTANVENLILNNSDRDGEAAMQFWGGSLGCVISGHICEDTRGMILHATDRRAQPDSLAGTQKCWFNDIRLCRFERGAQLDIWPARTPDPKLNNSGALVFGNTVRMCTFGDAPRLPRQNIWGAHWEGRRDIVQNRVVPMHQCAIRLGTRGGWSGDPDDPRWEKLTPAATFNLIERNYIDTGWPVGIHETRSARGNIITNNHNSAKRPLIRSEASISPPAEAKPEK